MNVFLFKKNIKRSLFRAKRVFTDRRCADSSLRILMYHSVGGNPEDHRLAIRVPLASFESQLNEIKNCGRKIVTVSEAISRLSARISQESLAITFDDGYRDNFVSVAGVLSDYGLKATFFVTISLIDGRVKKHWSDNRIREYMDWGNLISLSKAGHEIGSHMIHHTDLRTLGHKELIRELRGSKDAIEDKIKMPVKVFSYPYGGVNKKVIEAAINVGYIGGCSSLRGCNRFNQDPYLLRRTEIDGFDMAADFRDKLMGTYD